MQIDIEKIKEFAERKMASCKDPAHNIEHALRVYNNALRIAKGEKVNLEVIKIAALLHDIGGEKETNNPEADHALESAKIAKPFLEKMGLTEKKINHILDCIISHRYRTDQKPETLEAKIIFDADKLETMGAIGIARGFVWIGKNNAHIYHKPNLQEYIKDNLEDGKINGKIKDKSKHSLQINWETKDKFYFNYLQTKKAKELSKKRRKFFANFLKQLENEVKGIE